GKHKASNLVDHHVKQRQYYNEGADAKNYDGKYNQRILCKSCHTSYHSYASKNPVESKWWAEHKNHLDTFARKKRRELKIPKKQQISVARLINGNKPVKRTSQKKRTTFKTSTRSTKKDKSFFDFVINFNPFSSKSKIKTKKKSTQKKKVFSTRKPTKKKPKQKKKKQEKSGRSFWNLFSLSPSTSSKKKSKKSKSKKKSYSGRKKSKGKTKTPKPKKSKSLKPKKKTKSKKSKSGKKPKSRPRKSTSRKRSGGRSRRRSGGRARSGFEGFGF
ncbi:MAG: hypothetical protein GTO02_09825, partial [Candidatus Dadabacteria bacterium]|nr:hypothetical protein [Candidatus Dadabacteria bacterium]